MLHDAKARKVCQAIGCFPAHRKSKGKQDVDAVAGPEYWVLKVSDADPVSLRCSCDQRSREQWLGSTETARSEAEAEEVTSKGLGCQTLVVAV